MTTDYSLVHFWRSMPLQLPAPPAEAALFVEVATADVETLVAFTVATDEDLDPATEVDFEPATEVDLEPATELDFAVDLVLTAELVLAVDFTLAAELDFAVDLEPAAEDVDLAVVFAELTMEELLAARWSVDAATMFMPNVPPGFATAT